MDRGAVGGGGTVWIDQREALPLYARIITVLMVIFPKLIAISQLVYQAGFNVANSERTLERDNLGPRTVKGFQGKIKK